ncbi:MAG: hypothetical protein KAV00_09285 [Phycisphaerae bacterium]|nr:hypothetical protein [Phycisphaerae bacterium]
MKNNVSVGLVVAVVLVGLAPAAGESPKSAGKTKSNSATLKIWDAGKHYPGNWTAWAISFKNRAAWKQVPYEKTDYKFNGDTVLENKFFYISFNANSQDDLNVKKGKGTLWRNIFYRCYYPKKIKVGGTKRYASRTKHVKILKNTPNEVMVEHTGLRSSIMTTYRLFKDKPWVEVKPVKNAHMLGIHGKVRMALAVVEDGNDYVIDSLRDPKHSYVPPKGRLIICFFESVKNPFMYVLTFPSFKRANTYFNCDSGPKGDTMWCDPGTRGGLKIPKKWPGCITATYSRFGNQTEPVVEGALAYWHNWYRDHPDRPIKKGEVYTCKWKPPYPGKWRMTVRVAEKKYDQGFKYDGKTKFPAKYFSKDVTVSKNSTNDGNFTFKSPIDGWLDYAIIYMYDRTKETPHDILTPMDQYRWTRKQTRR